MPHRTALGNPPEINYGPVLDADLARDMDEMRKACEGWARYRASRIAHRLLPRNWHDSVAFVGRPKIAAALERNGVDPNDARAVGCAMWDEVMSTLDRCYHREFNRIYPRILAKILAQQSELMEVEIARGLGNLN